MVRPSNRLKTAGKWLTGFGVGLVIYRVIITAIRMTELPDRGPGFFDLLLFGHIPSALRRSEGFNMIALWLGLALVVAGIVCIAIAAMMAPKVAETSHQRYLSGGYVARGERIGYRFTARSANTDIVLLTHPSQDGNQFASLLQYVHQRPANADKPTLARVEGVARVIAQSSVASAALSTVFPDIQAPNVITRARRSAFVVVVPAAVPGKPPQIYETREKSRPRASFSF